MSTPLRREVQTHTSSSSHEPLDTSIEHRPTAQEEIAGRARERTNAHASTPAARSGGERVGYASRELERLARSLANEAMGLREKGEEGAAKKLERTAGELRALAQAMAASRRT